MKKIMNITTSRFDLPRYSDNNDLKQAYRQFGLDGLELMEGGDDENQIIAIDDVIGAHLKYFNYWVCVWNGDDDAALAEHGNWETCKQVFGGRGREVIVEAHIKNLEFVSRYEPEYLVFHVSDVSIQECITREHGYSDIHVIDAVIDLVNTVFTDANADYTLLFENLWWPGMNMKEPELVEYLLSKVNYPKSGVMLDMGHLLHTDSSLRTADEGIDIYTAPSISTTI